MPVGSSWADKAEGSTSREGGNSSITANDVQAARAAVAEAQLAMHTVDILTGPMRLARKYWLTASQLSIRSARQLRQMKRRQSQQQQQLQHPYRDARTTDGIIATVVAKMGHELRLNLMLW